MWFRSGYRRPPSVATGYQAVAAIAAVDGVRLTEDQVAAAAVLAEAGNVYLAGPPGTGKTAVVDWWVRACRAAGRPRVARRHLQDFFVELHRLVDIRGGWVAGLDALIRGYDVLCLDEFTVHDPADGVFLDRVLRTLEARGMRIIVTSNRRPAELMPNPLFHAGFEPTAGLIEGMFQIVGFDRGRDMRTAARRVSGFGSGTWCTDGWVRPRDMPGCPDIRGRIVRPGPLAFPVYEGVDSSVGVDFADLCGRPAGVADYLWFANEYSAMVVSSVRSDLGVASLARWAMVLDVMHDADVRVDVQACCTRAEMGAALAAALPDASRTVSRMGAWQMSDRRVR